MITAGLIAGRDVVEGRQQPPSQPTFRSGVQIVEVDVRVFDKDNRFVTDLTQDDFELVEDGKPQRIDAMYLVRGQTGVGPGPDPTQTGVIAGSDSPAPPPVAPQTWIFFFDLNHLTPGSGFDRARKAVEDFVASRFKDGDLAGVLAGDKMINNRLTSVRRELLDAIAQVKPRSDSRTRYIELTREWPRLQSEEEAIRIARAEREWIQRAVVRACADDQQQCEVADSAVRQKGQKVGADILRASLESLRSLNALANGLARVPGPKTLVLLSDGFVAQEIETTVRGVIGQIARAGGRVYAIDVRGLDRTGSNVEQLQADDPAGPSVKFDSLADGPNSVAVDTGGIMIRNENNIGRALDRVAEDAGTYYVLAYRPANADFDGKFRPIQVRVRRDGLRVRARKGYLALPPARMTVPQPVNSGRPEDAQGTAHTPDAVPPTAADPKPIEPVNALPPSIGTVVAPGAATETPGAVRLRPDTEERIKALSDRENIAVDRKARTADVERGWDAYQKGDIETAEAAFSKAAGDPSVRPWVLYALGMSQAALGRVDDAIASWQRVRRAVPDFEPVYMDLADSYAAKSDLSSALAIVREAEKRWPKSADVQSAIGVIHVRRGALDEGIAALAEASRLSPEDGLMLLNLGRAYALRFHRGRRYVTSQRRWVAPEGDRERAIEALQRCVALGGPYAAQATEELSVLKWSK